MGLLSKLPIPVGPGLGCAAYFAYGLKTETVDSEDPLADSMMICFLAGLLMFVLAVVNLPHAIFSVVPSSVKDAIPVSCAFNTRTVLLHFNMHQVSKLSLGGTFFQALDFLLMC